MDKVTITKWHITNHPYVTLEGESSLPVHFHGANKVFFMGQINDTFIQLLQGDGDEITFTRNSDSWRVNFISSSSVENWVISHDDFDRIKRSVINWAKEQDNG